MTDFLLPEAPTNVRIVDHDGIEHPVEVTYRGIDDHGNNLWVATTRWVGLPKGVNCEVLPPCTTIAIEFG